jgi:tRNA 2-thiouridine synthesizing protein A
MRKNTVASQSIPPAGVKVLDASGLECPLPVLKARAELARLQPGDVLQVIATDRHAPLDLQVFCMQTGHEFVELIETAERCEIVIRKRA